MWFQCIALLYSFTTLVNRLVLVHCNVNHPLKQKLAKWHTLKQSDIYLQRHKRSLSNDGVVVPLDKQVSFDAFNKTFTLSLMPSVNIFSPGFKAVSQNGKGEDKELRIDKTTILSGTVMDDPKSHVTAHYDGRTLMATIDTQKDTYIVEPMWRHLPQFEESTESYDAQQTDHTDMLVYRQSDVIQPNYPHSETGFCETKSLDNSRDRSPQNKQAHDKSANTQRDNRKQSSTSHHRSKRSSGNKKKICKLSLVADFRFFENMGNSNELETMYYLISLIERVNTIYKRTSWGPQSESNNYKGYGFQINLLKVHTEPTNNSDSRFRYNQNVTLPPDKLLEAFSETNYSRCLSHLFTYIDFPKGTLGIAHTGSPHNPVGGICSESSVKKSEKKILYTNTGLTTTVNWGRRILTTEADLVTAHELGHNFGAVHDDETKTLSGNKETSCTPGQAHGGNYIMFQIAVSGQYENNKKFSDCSRHTIFPMLVEKSHKCFEEENQSFCGNYKVEPGETCDVGLFIKDDKCCFPHNCTLKPHANCSNRNSKCCNDNCQVADDTKLCRKQIQGLCHKDTFCDGKKFECPEEEPAKDGMECGDKGECRNGKCEQFCTIKGLLPCLCSEPEVDQCKRCCANKTSSNTMSTCQPFLFEDGRPDYLMQNAPCVLGYCSKHFCRIVLASSDDIARFSFVCGSENSQMIGLLNTACRRAGLRKICQKHTQDVIERGSIFEYIAPDKIGEFLADNIVGGVLVFSLLFWIPCSCLVNYVDKKRLQKNRKMREKRAEFNRSFSYTFRPAGSMPNTPRIRIVLDNANRIPSKNISSGLAHEQRTQEEYGAEMFNFRSRMDVDRLGVVPGSPNDDDAVLSHPQTFSINMTAAGKNRAMLLSGSHQSYMSQSEKSFDEEIKPIAVSSNTNLPALIDQESPISPSRTSGPFRHSLTRQKAVVSP